MDDFPHDVWLLHRKIHHRYIKYNQCFESATHDLPSYMSARNFVSLEPKAKKAKLTTQKKASVPSTDNVICLMSDSTTDEEDDEADIGADKEEDDDDEDEDDDDEQTASAEPVTEWVSTIIIYT